MHSQRRSLLFPVQLKLHQLLEGEGVLRVSELGRFFGEGGAEGRLD